MPEGTSPRIPSGTTDTSGKFKLTSYDTDDGAPAGNYIVVIMPGRSADGKKQSDRTAQDLVAMGPGAKIESEVNFPEKYSDKKTSGLKRSVVAGDTNTFNFDLSE